MTNVNCPQAAVRARPSVAGQTFTVAMELPPSYEEATKQDDAFTRIIIRVGSQFCRQVFTMQVSLPTKKVYPYCTPQSKIRSEYVEILVFLPSMQMKYDLIG